MKHKNIASLVEDNKTVFIIIAVVLILIELEILAVAMMKSGSKSMLHFSDQNGNLVYVTDGNNLSDFNKYYFEKTFGPVSDFQRKLVVKETPFPFRAWFTAAVGIPVGIILLFAFTVKAYVSLFHEDAIRNKEEGNKESQKKNSGTEFERMMTTVSSFNIFTIGFLVLLLVFMYWVLPNMVGYIAKVSVDTLVRFKWVVISGAAALIGLFAWVIYLRYLLAKRSIDNQAELNKIRLELEYSRGIKPQARLEYHEETVEEARETPLVSWKENETEQTEEAETLPDEDNIRPETIHAEVPNNT
ncbi:MAG: hypothetical protein V2I97_00310 [Desulfococcaceae bacterium]|jgi:hypothetical protein|nr:hypothetical protein [Desulfococcaceae bacterium]